MMPTALHSFRVAIELFTYSAIAYASLAVLIKGRKTIALTKRALPEIRLNLAWYFVDALFIAPAVGLAIVGCRLLIDRYSLAVLDTAAWAAIGKPATIVAAVFVGDFVSYWRHRLEHTRWIWPAHAIHHSDSQMMWLTLARFHPVNRFVTASIDIGVLTLLGFPTWALVANEIVRHYYGEFIHADLPWTYGPLGRVFVSPTMHQWHHARDVVGAGSNFATVFSIFDRAFGTHHVPGVCDVPLGVTEEVGSAVSLQLLYPFVYWLRDSRRDSSHPTGITAASRVSLLDNERSNSTA
jgi:sterol desaturase/sphingolipid hydroxylase (fatty acid hydroxylase superfamily)